MKKTFLLLLWVMCLLLPSCISSFKINKLKEKAMSLEIENALLKEKYKAVINIEINYKECLNDLRQYKQRLVNCDKKLGVCFNDIKKRP